MDPADVHDFATRLMTEVWEPFAYQEVGRFYQQDVRGHHLDQELTFTDVVNRLQWDPDRYVDQDYDITDIIAAEDRFAIRFMYTATLAATGEPFRTEVNYFYRLRDGLISEFWLLSDHDFDYKARD